MAPKKSNPSASASTSSSGRRQTRSTTDLRPGPITPISAAGSPGTTQAGNPLPLSPTTTTSPAQAGPAYNTRRSKRRREESPEDTTPQGAKKRSTTRSTTAVTTQPPTHTITPASASTPGNSDDDDDEDEDGDEEKEAPMKGGAPPADIDDQFEVIENVSEALIGIPNGDVAYGQPLPNAIAPQLAIRGVCPVKFPLDEQRLAEIRGAGQQVHARKVVSDWPLDSTHTFTSIVPVNDITIENKPEWDAHVEKLAARAGEYLGIGAKSVKIRTRARNLYLWEASSLWRCYISPHEEEGGKWFGTLLLIIDQNCETGKIAFRHHTKGLVIDPSTSSQYMVASHAGSKIDVMPLSNGYRLALSYELYWNKSPQRSSTSLLDRIANYKKVSDAALLNALKVWALQIKHGELENFPLVHVLSGEYDQKKVLDIDSVNAQDRAVAQSAYRATHDESLSPRLGYALAAYFVLVKAVSKNYAGDIEPRVRYSVELAANLDGAPRPDVKKIPLDATGIMQPEKFEGGLTKQVTSSMSTSTKDCPCLMLMWDEE